MACALGELLSGGAWEDTGLPECFQPTLERMIKNGWVERGGSNHEAPKVTDGDRFEASTCEWWPTSS